MSRHRFLISSYAFMGSTCYHRCLYSSNSGDLSARKSLDCLKMDYPLGAVPATHQSARFLFITQYSPRIHAHIYLIIFLPLNSARPVAVLKELLVH
jgi:hypothetical protein